MKLSYLIHLFFFSLILCACSTDPRQKQSQSNWNVPNNKLKVLSTIGMIDDIVRIVGGGHVDSLTLIKSELDPHSYQLVKGDDEKLANADLIFFNDLGLEHGPSLQKYLNNTPKAVSLGKLISKDHPELIIYCHGQIDPHLWMDISLWSKTVPYIVKSLSDKDPAHAKSYEENGRKLVDDMANADLEIKTEMQSIPSDKRYLVTSHDAFNYFTRAYLADPEEIKSLEWDKRFAAPEGLSPESQLCSTDIKLIIEHLKKFNITVLFTETNVSKDSIKKILQAGKENGLNLKISTTSLYADSMGLPGSSADTYLKMIRHNADTIKKFIMENHDNSVQ